MKAFAVFLETESLATLAAPGRTGLVVLEGRGVTPLVHLTADAKKLNVQEGYYITINKVKNRPIL